MAPQLEARHLDTLRRCFAATLSDAHCTVVLFGSRARGTARPGSDVDLAVIPGGAMGARVARLREALEESPLPYKVDVVDLSIAEPALTERINGEGIALWRN